jgi:hypothetical protein
MSAPSALAADAPPPAWASLSLRLAQRAFAQLVEGSAHDASRPADIRLARLRSHARRTLSVLSADDQASIARWLALQFASRDPAAPSPAWLARVDAAFAACVEGLRADAGEWLHARAEEDAFAA